MEPALAHWLNTMHPTPGNTASDRLGDAARAVEPKDTWTPVSADEAERVVRALVDDAAAEGTRATASEEPGAKSPARGRARPKAALAVGALIFLVATVVILTLISRSPAQSGQGMASLAGQAPPHGNPSSPSEAAHHPIQEQEQEMNRATVAAAAAGLIVAGESFAQSAVQWRVEDGGNGHWYQAKRWSQTKSWTEARDAAAAAGGHLACITTEAENHWVHQHSDLSQPGCAAGSDGWHIGGYQDKLAADYSEPAGGWRWVSGEPWSYTAWLVGYPGGDRPNNFGGDESYLKMSELPYAPYWDDVGPGSDQANMCGAIIEWSADCNNDGVVDYGQCRYGSLADENRNNVPDCCEQLIECQNREPGIVSAWGSNSWGERNVPDLVDAIQVAGGNDHVLALRSDGTVRAWGRNSSGQSSVPADLAAVVQVEGGGDHSVALLSDGSIRCWGGNGFGQCNVPAGIPGSAKVDAGGLFTVALGVDGLIRAWGLSNLGQTDVPSDLGSVSNVSAGDRHAVVLRPDGSVRCWGDDSQGQSTVPQGASGVLAVAAGSFHTMVLRADGSVTCWGAVNSVPGDLGSVRAIAGGGAHAIVLLTDGQVRSWGRCSEGQCQAPANLRRVQSIAGWSYGTLSVSSDASCNADLTQNGTVDGADLGALLAFWGPVNPVFPQADINGDGTVNGADLGVLLSVWGPCGG
jgi:alpha-tubulin suppressor-like RCC1 family protein